MAARQEREFFTAQPVVSSIDFWETFSKKRQCAFAVHINGNDILIDHNVPEIVDKQREQRLCSAVRIAWQFRSKDAIQVMCQNGHGQVEVDFDDYARTITIQMEEVDVFRYISFDQPSLCILADNVDRLVVGAVRNNRRWLYPVAFYEYLPQFVIAVELVQCGGFAVHHFARFVVCFFDHYGLPF